jgi:hypothetical protein
MKLKLAMVTPQKWEGTLIPVACTPFLIGREPGCDLRAKSSTVGLRHCGVVVRDHRVFVCAFVGSSGTFVNDREVQGEVEVHDGDRVQAGCLSFVIRLEGQPRVAAAERLSRPLGQAEEEAGQLLLALDAQEELGEAACTPAAAGPTAQRGLGAARFRGSYPARGKPDEESSASAALASNLLAKYRKNSPSVERKARKP